MILDARITDIDLNRHSDILIVGGGVAGITLARKLSARYQVTVIESGGLEAEAEVQSLYEGESVGLDYSLEGSRLRFLGGTSNHWGGWCGQFDAQDFDQREWVPHSGWPISRGDLTPYYEETASILNLGRAEFSPSSLTSDERLDQFVDNPWLEHRVFRFSKPIVRMGSKFRQQLDEDENPTVLLNSNAVELRLDESGSRINQVRVQTLEGQKGTINARVVILCCGAIENARLLLTSRGQQSSGIGNRHDIVGRFFMEHPHIDLLELLPHDLDWCNAQMALRKDANHWFGLGLTLSEEARLRQQCLNMTAHFFNRSCSPGETLRLSAMFEQAPNPSSRVTLSDRKDSLGQPRTRLDWRLSTLDYESIRKAAYTIARTLGSKGLGRIKLGTWAGQEDGYQVGYGSHHMGTTRMSDSPRQGVVNTDCRVHDVDNLYIAGSSVYPTSGPINPTFTLTALTLRLADHLLQ